MTITQITRIQHRRGNESDLPQSLGDAELGFTTDTGRLFIGAEYHPIAGQRAVFPYKNIEILTEYSPLGLEILKYTNSNHNVRGEAISRSLQGKLDEFTSVKDYGAVGDGDNDDTEALLYAILDTSDVATSNNFRTLYFPAGIYRITRPLLLPPRSIWVGEGISDVQGDSITSGTRGQDEGNTVIMLEYTKDDSAVDVYQEFTKCMVRTADSGIFNEDDPFDPGSYDGNYSISDDGTNYDLPENIYIHGINFTVDDTNDNTDIDVIRLDRASNVTFSNCRFESVFDFSDKNIKDTSDHEDNDSILIRIDSLGIPKKPSNIKFDGCIFTKGTFGFYMTDDISDVIIQNCQLTEMYSGIVLGGNINNNSGELTGGVDGPSNIKLSHSTMNEIQSSGFIVYNGQYNSSSFNYYDKVGYEGQECVDEYDVPLDDGVSCISFEPGSELKPGSAYNTSIGDTFCYNGDNNSKRIDDKGSDNLIVYPQKRIVQILKPEGDAREVTWDLNHSTFATLELTNSVRIINPKNGVNGQVYQLEIKQDSTGNRGISWGDIGSDSNFEWGHAGDESYVNENIDPSPGASSILTFIKLDEKIRFIDITSISSNEISEDEIYDYTADFITNGTGIKVDADDSSNIITISIADEFTQAHEAHETKLDGIEDGAEVNVQSNWDEVDVSSDAFIQNKPTLFSGSYNDLSEKPIISGQALTEDNVYDYVSGFITDGTGIDIVSNSSDNTITISLADTMDFEITKEQVYEHADDIITSGDGISIELNSTDNTITISRDSLTESDIPGIGTDKITSGTFNSDRLAENGEEGQILTKTSSGHEWQDLESDSGTPPLEELTDGTNIEWDVGNNPLAYVTLGGDRTLSNPTNARNGGIYTILVQQDSTGSRELSYGDEYGFGSIGEPTLSSAANTYDVLTFMYFDGKMQLQSINQGY